MAKSAKAPNSFAGRWRNISMEQWAQAPIIGLLRHTDPYQKDFAFPAPAP
jgi:hypothetical protein